MDQPGGYPRGGPAHPTRADHRDGSVPGRLRGDVSPDGRWASLPSALCRRRARVSRRESALGYSTRCSFRVGPIRDGFGELLRRRQPFRCGPPDRRARSELASARKTRYSDGACDERTIRALETMYDEQRLTPAGPHQISAFLANRATMGRPGALNRNAAGTWRPCRSRRADEVIMARLQRRPPCLQSNDRRAGRSPTAGLRVAGAAIGWRHGTALP